MELNAEGIQLLPNQDANLKGAFKRPTILMSAIGQHRAVWNDVWGRKLETWNHIPNQQVHHTWNEQSVHYLLFWL